MEQMNWDDLRVFLALAHSENIREVADRCGVSYSTVSRRIEGFERRLSARLFDRLPTGFVLTATGEELLPLAEDIEERVGPVVFPRRFELWLLKHSGLRTNARVSILSDFLAKRIKQHQPLLTGQHP